MKKLWYGLLLVAVLPLWVACQSAPSGAAVGSSADLDSSAQAVAPVDNGTPEVSGPDWQQVFTFHNGGGVAGRFQLGHDYELDLVSAEGPRLHIYSMSMADPWAKMEVRTVAEGQTLQVLFSKYIDGTGFDDFAPAQELFSLVQTGDQLETHWEGLQPTYGAIGSSCSCFAGRE